MSLIIDVYTGLAVWGISSRSYSYSDSHSRRHGSYTYRGSIYFKYSIFHKSPSFSITGFVIFISQGPRYSNCHHVMASVQKYWRSFQAKSWPTKLMYDGHMSITQFWDKILFAFSFHFFGIFVSLFFIKNQINVRYHPQYELIDTHTVKHYNSNLCHTQFSGLFITY